MRTREEHHSRRRRAGAVGVLAALLTGTAVPAQAGILGDLTRTVTGTVTGVVDTTTSLADSTARSLLGPTGWIEEGGVTGLDHVADVIGADRLHRRGVTGAGIGVALIDTGVVPVAGLTVGQRRQRPRPVLREPVRRAPLPRHLRPRHAHGRDHRRPRRRPRAGRLPRRRAGRQAHHVKVGVDRRRRRRVPGDRRRSTGSSSTATTTRRTRSGCSTCPTAPTACRTTASTRWRTPWRTPGAPASSSSRPAATAAPTTPG